MNTQSNSADLTRLVCPYVPKNPRQLYDAINPYLKRIGAIGELIAIAATHDELDSIQDIDSIGDMLKREAENVRAVLDIYDEGSSG